MKNLFKNRTVVGLTAIVLSLIICFGVTPLFNNALQSKISIVRMVKDVNAGEQITADNIQVVEIGKYNLPNTVLKNKENVVGKYATTDLFKGDYILNTKVSASPLSKNKYLYGLDGNKQAISISIKSFAAGLSGKIETGDIISIIVSNYGELRETITPKELEYVRVLAVTTNKGSDKEYTDNKKDDKEQELPSTVTLLVNKTQAKLLAELEEKGKMHVSLIYRGNEETAQKFIDEQEKVIKDSTGSVTSNVEVNNAQKAQGGM
jgi:pilus assembly protein CpaB